MKSFATSIGYTSSTEPHHWYRHLTAFLFFATLCAPILAPIIGGRSVYPYWFVPLLDVDFLRHLLSHLSKRVAVTISLTVSGALIAASPIIVAKVLILVLLLAYLAYLRRVQLFHYFYLCMAGVVFFAVIQYAALLLDPSLAKMLGPENIGSMLWGGAAKGNTNFYATAFTGGLLPRVSGLSGESGFFNALITVALLLYLSDSERKRRSNWFIAILAVGFFVSISKIGLGVAAATVMLLPFRRALNLASGTFVVIVFTISMTLLFTFFYSIDFRPVVDDQSVVHRTNGYYLLSQVSVLDLIMPMDRDELLRFQAELLEPGIFTTILKFRDSVTGIPYLIIELGLIGFLGCLMALLLAGTAGFNAMLFLLATFNVTPLTSDSFVVLATFYLVHRAYRPIRQAFRASSPFHAAADPSLKPPPSKAFFR